MPIRVQLKREKGWRLPAGCISVARPTKWGNPYTIKGAIEHGFARTQEEAQWVCVSFFRTWLHESSPTNPDKRDIVMANLDDLAGHDLACWCAIEKDGVYVPCHADILLCEANGLSLEDVREANTKSLTEA